MAVQHTAQGNGAPTSTPPSRNAHYLDESTGDVYIAVGTSGPEDWKKMLGDAEADAKYQAQGSYVSQETLNTALEGKVDTVPGKGLSTEDYTTAEKQKLAGLEGSHFRGTFLSLSALQAGATDPVPGDYADVDAGVGESVARYVWDDSDSAWVAQGGSADPLTAAQVKTLYESNPDTNAFTDAEKNKLAGLASGGGGGGTAVRTFQRSSAAGVTTIRSTDVALYLEGVQNLTGTDYVEVSVEMAPLVGGQVFDIDVVSADGHDGAILPYVTFNPPVGAAFTGVTATGVDVSAAANEGILIWALVIRHRARLRILATQMDGGIGYHAELEVIELQPAVGSLVGGGYLAGTYEIDGVPYQLIMAPKEHETLGTQWKLTSTSTSGSSSAVDGLGNTETLAATGEHPAAQYCAELVIGDYSDWYLPSSGEFAFVAEMLSPSNIGLPDELRTGGAQALAEDWYWTSTTVNMSDAVVILGHRYFDSAAGNVASTSYYTRPVRRIPMANG